MSRIYVSSSAMMAAICLAGIGAFAGRAAAQLGEQPTLREHVDQADIDAGRLTLNELFVRGQRLFDARFNRLDGQGRPGSRGDGLPREPVQPPFIRTSAPDAISCSGCHAQPRSGGAGDFVANVFVLAQALDPVTTSVDANFSNERNTLGMMGAGPIEMLAREMSAELIAIRDQARVQAIATGQPVTRPLTAKGVGFGSVTVLPDGRVDPSGIQGVDWDLIIKPFHQKGAVVSLREFTNNAMNHHHGMQPVERFGLDVDADGDGVVNELTVGDITAASIFQAALNTPARVIPRGQEAALADGERLFEQIGCTACHVPEMTLRSRMFTEPNPFNPPGNLRPLDVAQPFSFDMTAQGPAPRLERTPDGGAIVRAFTDLKRHNLNDEELRHFANEQVPQGRLNGFAPASDFTIPPPTRPTEEFLTRKLWDCGNSDPFGHRGDLTTMTDVIHFHGGEARAAREAFFALSQADRDKVIGFVRSLQVVPDGSPPIVFANAQGDLEPNTIIVDLRNVAQCGPVGLIPLPALTVCVCGFRAGRRGSRRGA